MKSLSRVRLSDPMGCCLPGSSVHGIFQARVLEWVAITLYNSLYKVQVQEKLIYSKKKILVIETVVTGTPWWSSGYDSTLPVQGAWVGSLVRELDPPHAAPKILHATAEGPMCPT